MAITNARMQIKRGNESEFDPEKMLPGEWAVSLDTKYVRMCFSPGVCIRMATYDAFEADVAKIQGILEEVQTIEEAVTRINTEISEKANAVAEYTEQAKGYRAEAKQFRDEAETSATNAKTSEDKAKVSETNANVSETNAKISEENARRVAESLPEDYTELSKAFYNTAIKQKAVGDNIHVTDSADSKIVEFGLYGKATQDGEPTTDNPIEIVVSGSSGSVAVKSCGKNLLKNEATSKTVNGITFTVNDDKSVTANGTSSTASARLTLKSKQFISAGKYYCSGSIGGDGKYQIFCSLYDENKKYYGERYNANGQNLWDIPQDSYVDFVIDVLKDKTLDNVTFYPMLRLSTDTDSTYEPYKETLSTIPTPNGLCGIKVDSNGNYTDENGQQWITDEIVKYANGSGKRVQRIGKTIFDGSDDEGWTTTTTSQSDVYRIRTNVLSGIAKAPTDNNKTVLVGLSNIFKMVPAGTNGTWTGVQGISMNATGEAVHVYSDIYNTSDVSLWTAYLAENPMTLYYELAEPIITDLTAEEIAEIEKLHTFYPITNISNDSDCGMEVTYIADSKNYIDGQLAIQKAQQEEALATMLLLMPEEVQASMIENDTNNLLNESEV